MGTLAANDVGLLHTDWMVSHPKMACPANSAASSSVLLLASTLAFLGEGSIALNAFSRNSASRAASLMALLDKAYSTLQ